MSHLASLAAAKRGEAHADGRPRIHIWRVPAGALYSFGPTGERFNQLSVGSAVESALEQIEHQPAVIIFEGDRGFDRSGWL